MTNTIKENAYRMLVLAVMTLLMAANLSQPAFADLERPELRDCIDIDKAIESDERFHWKNVKVGLFKGVIKFQNTCEESWTVKYLYQDKPSPNSPRHPYDRWLNNRHRVKPEYIGPHERALKQGESFIVSYVDQTWAASIYVARGWPGIIYRGCPSTDDTLSGVDSYDALKDFQCAWR